MHEACQSRRCSLPWSREFDGWKPFDRSSRINLRARCVKPGFDGRRRNPDTPSDCDRWRALPERLSGDLAGNERGRQLRYSKLVRNDQPSCGNLVHRWPLVSAFRRLEWAAPAQPPAPLLLGPLLLRDARNERGRPLRRPKNNAGRSGIYSLGAASVFPRLGL
jgi:hypothetical protein